jgi:hypothetical protein
MIRAGNLAACGKSIQHPGQARLTSWWLRKPAAGHSNSFFKGDLSCRYSGKTRSPKEKIDSAV